jgi:hypothetical protein
MTAAMSDPTLFDQAFATLPTPLGIEPWLDAHLDAYAPAT